MPEIENLWLEGKVPSVFQTRDAPASRTARLEDAWPQALEPDVFNIRRLMQEIYCLTEYMKVLIGAGADVNLMGRCDAAWSGDDLEEMTPLMVLTSWSVDHSVRVLDAARLLMNAGGDIGLRSSLGRTALQMAEEMTDWKNWKARIGRHAPESLLRTAAHQSEQLVELLKHADTPPVTESDALPKYKQVTWWTN